MKAWDAAVTPTSLRRVGMLALWMQTRSPAGVEVGVTVAVALGVLVTLAVGVGVGGVQSVRSIWVFADGTVLPETAAQDSTWIRPTPPSPPGRVVQVPSHPGFEADLLPPTPPCADTWLVPRAACWVLTKTQPPAPPPPPP